MYGGHVAKNTTAAATSDALPACPRVMARHLAAGSQSGFSTAPGGKGEMLTVFIPSNNLYLGDIVLVPAEDVVATGLTVEEGIRIILSAGTATPTRLPRI